MLINIDKELRKFAKEHYFEKVLNVGAKSENENDFPFKNPKSFFNARKYIGIDLREGRWVDRVMDVKALEFPDSHFDCVICTETFEHVDDPFQAAKEIMRVLKPGGFLFFSAPFNFPFHDIPIDYWRFTPQGIKVLFKGMTVERLRFNGDEKNPATVMMVFRKRANK